MVVSGGRGGGVTRTGLRPAYGTSSGVAIWAPTRSSAAGRPGQLVRRLILSDDRRRNAAALADLVAALLGPSPNFRTALAARSAA